MTVVIRNAIAAAALAAIFAPAGFAQQTPQPADQQRDARAKCEQLTGVARENCLERLNADRRERGATNPNGQTQPSDLPKGPAPTPGTSR